MIEKEGGKVEESQVTIKTQKPVAVKYEKAFEGHYPVDKMAVNTVLQDKTEWMFDGIGFVLKGYVKCADEDYVAQVEMHIDGNLIETANLPVAKASSIDDRRVDLFHRYQLQNTTHKVGFKWLNPRKDAQVYLGEAVIYSDKQNFNH